MSDSTTLAALVFLGRTLQFGSGMLLADVALFRCLVLPPSFGRSGTAEETGRFLRCLDLIFGASACALIFSGVLLFIAATAGMSGVPLTAVFNGNLMSTVLWQTEFGRVCQVRAGLALALVLVIGSLCHPRSRRKMTRRILEIASAILATALFVSVAWTSHAAALSHPGIPWALVSDATHLAFTSIWPGGLVPFALLLLYLRKAGPLQIDPLLHTVRRFSTVSLIAVGGIAVTGTINGILLVGSLENLVNSSYGRLLCLKLIVFSLMLCAATFNRQVLLPRIFAHGKALQEDRVLAIMSLLRFFVFAEVGLAAVVIMVVSILGVTPPPALPE